MNSSSPIKKQKRQESTKAEDAPLEQSESEHSLENRETERRRLRRIIKDDQKRREKNALKDATHNLSIFQDMVKTPQWKTHKQCIAVLEQILPIYYQLDSKNSLLDEELHLIKLFSSILTEICSIAQVDTIADIVSSLGPQAQIFLMAYLATSIQNASWDSSDRLVYEVTDKPIREHKRVRPSHLKAMKLEQQPTHNAPVITPLQSSLPRYISHVTWLKLLITANPNAFGGDVDKEFKEDKRAYNDLKLARRVAPVALHDFVSWNQTGSSENEQHVLSDLLHLHGKLGAISIQHSLVHQRQQQEKIAGEEDGIAVDVSEEIE
ncbi:hypothetical protein BLNAU_10303 [Blattamonas nauphoetae]|uniref:Uncharacterized protein n=1 Tax=Blattamonas nauphoetae TaxID=2049346 RepID=A0ABQ9XSC6_9EUKA|nr:hypothetical protein BLNAU_10303 [Blattamonas nauphoetae]